MIVIFLLPFFVLAWLVIGADHPYDTRSQRKTNKTIRTFQNGVEQIIKDKVTGKGNKDDETN